MENIRFTTELDDIVECDLVIENITEDIEKKNALYTRMNTICGASTVFGVNTSAISITALSKLMRHPENVVGVHFMNPVPLMHTVELIRGVHTAERTLNIFHHLFAQLNKTGIVVNDSPGFVTNRAMMILLTKPYLWCRSRSPVLRISIRCLKPASGTRWGHYKLPI